MSRAYANFYLAINFGSFLSTLATPALLSRLLWPAPGLWRAWHSDGRGDARVLVRASKIHPHSAAWEGLSARDVRTRGPRGSWSSDPALPILLGVWSLYDQTGSAWVTQAESMDRNFLGIDWLSSQVASVNALLILVLVPLFNGITVPLPHRLTRRSSGDGRRGGGSSLALDGGGILLGFGFEFELRARGPRFSSASPVSTSLSAAGSR